MKTVVITLLILLGLVTIIAWLTDRKKPTAKQVDDVLYKHPQQPQQHRSCSSCRFADEPTDCPQCVACESYSNWSARV